MRNVPDQMTETWRSEVKVGDDRRPVVRATIQKTKLARFDYDKGEAPGQNFGHQFRFPSMFTSIIFGQPSKVREIQNIKRSTWSRSVDQDVAEGTLTVSNTRLVAIGEGDQNDSEEFDRPGWYTFNRGEAGNPWGYAKNGWNGVMVPDRLIRTYEGYGLDHTVAPDKDPHLLQAGTWLIDDIGYTASGDIEIKMRDVGRVLLDQICFPPLIPYREYPLQWSKIRTEDVLTRSPTGGAFRRPAGTASSSNEAYVGKGLDNPPYRNYVGPGGQVNGHRPGDAQLNRADRDRPDEYWESTGQPDGRSKVWWQVDYDSPQDLNALRIHPKAGPYRIHISLKGPNGWIGKKKIPYDRDLGAGDVGISASIPFVDSVLASPGKTFDHVLRRKYRNVSAVRLTFSRLHDTGMGRFPFTAALRDLQAHVGPYDDLGFTRGETKEIVGNYSDFTDIVKYMCAWGGFFWPPHTTKQDFISSTDGSKTDYVYNQPDDNLPRGRAWGDFMDTGTAGAVDLTPDLFDKQPFMDVIAYVRDQLGFLFFIDETGGPVWRLPNLWDARNYLSPGQNANRNTRGRTTDFVTLRDDRDILDYTMTLSSKDLRDRLFVANSSGKFGAVTRGYKPFAVGLRRIAGWTDQNFESKRECLVMADMIAAEQMFNYRSGRTVIHGYPAIQMDDQIRIRERVTGEFYFHYVKGIQSDLDMVAGDWTYELDSHWLGPERDAAWVVDPIYLDQNTQNYLDFILDRES